MKVEAMMKLSGDLTKVHIKVREALVMVSRENNMPERDAMRIFICSMINDYQHFKPFGNKHYTDAEIDGIFDAMWKDMGDDDD